MDTKMLSKLTNKMVLANAKMLRADLAHRIAAEEYNRARNMLDIFLSAQFSRDSKDSESSLHTHCLKLVGFSGLTDSGKPNRIPTIKYLRQELGLDLLQAKLLTDEVIENRPQIVFKGSLEEMKTREKLMEAQGAVVQITEAN